MFAANSASRAKQHIKDIRTDFDLGALRPSRHVTNLERALTLLSDQLYQKPTHFLLELIQNADDNDYRAVGPVVTFTYHESRLRVDCNETGFSRANVEAICQIGQSTKAGKTETTRYIGEKGIGFKSVFKVADKVWISSNGYTFKFDKSQPLGMIAPIWEAFPQSTSPDVTSMLLEFSPSYDHTKLITELKGLDTRMLIFLQKLREVNVQIDMPGRQPWRTSLKKSEKVIEGKSVVTLIQDTEAFAYTISKHTAENMPSDPRRQGQKRSEILLAFPTTNTQTKTLEPQQVYAFLPIRDYGFKFLLQGDFLLSASREDILSDCPWNKALRDCFVNAFVSLIKSSHENFLHYNWPLFLPVESFPHEFFEWARVSIFQRLSRDFTVRNFLGKLSTPQALMQVPEQFRTKAGSPLLAFGSTSSLFLSDQYGEHCLESLERLGVRKMELTDFVGTLHEVLKNDSIAFREQPDDWHSEFARNILSALWKSDEDRAQWSIVRQLPIIPLEKNEWISAAKAARVGVFLPPESDVDLQLDGLDVKLVLKGAALDQSRASLYRHLDIPTINQSEICQYIANSLCRESPLPAELSADKLVLQTVFLFKAGWRNPYGQDMWFHTQTGEHGRGSCLYVQSSSRYSASHYFGSIKRLFLSETYLKTVQSMLIDADEFQSWLQDCMYLWEIPRLLAVTAVSGASSQFGISWEFSRLAQYSHTPWIYLLKDNFHKYSMFFDLGEVFKHKPYARRLGRRTKDFEPEHQRFVESIGTLRVKCIGDRFAELRETYLPHPGVIEDTDGRVPLVDVPDPEHTDWQYLKRFGLGIEPDLKMYLRCLEKLSLVPQGRLTGSKVDEKVARYMDQIQARYTEDTDMVKQYFSLKPIIRVPPISSRSSYRWVKTSNCLWDGGSCFRILPVLKNYYPGNETLFHKVLGCRVAKLEDLYIEATHFQLGYDIEHITAIFDEIEKRLRNEETDPKNCFGRLASNKIFPIVSGGGVSGPKTSYDKLCRVNPKVEWFIADRENLHQSFTNLLPLLALPVGTVQYLKKTMERMKLDRYLLSRCAKSRVEVYSVSVFDQDLSQEMLHRVPYVLRLIPSMIPVKTKRRIARHLRSLKVFLADQLTQEWSVTNEEGQVVQGRPYQANVVFVTEQDEALHIFLSQKYLARSVCKNEIVQHFADFCEIQDNKHLLNMALWESHEEVVNTFRNYGIPGYDPSIDSEEPLDEGDNEAEAAISEANKHDLQNTTSTGDPRHGQGSERYEEGVLESGEKPQNTQRLGLDWMRDKYRRSNGERRDTTHVACPHCARGHIRFARIEASSIFGIRTSDTGRGQAPQLSVFQPKRYRGFTDFIKNLGRSSKATTGNEVLPSVHVEDPGLQYKGESLFSMILAQFLDGSYEPDQHWTSSLRTRAGHTSFPGSSETHATFTLPDSAGTLTAVMLREHPDLARLWTTKPPKWHFEVKTTAGALDAPFYLTNAQVDRIRALSITSLSEPSQVPENVAVLVRVVNAEDSDTPEAHLYRDPWDMFLTGDVVMNADTLYRCSVRRPQASIEPDGYSTAHATGKELGEDGPPRGPAHGSKPPPPYRTEKDPV